jgi:acyl-CoA reductase-like NAD-dependent aldehyde dehydrogenase
MNAVANKDAINKITTHYIDAAFVESHGREVMDIINPTNSEVIARVTLGDAEDAQRAIRGFLGGDGEAYVDWLEERALS